jgi:hypothetical protein
MIQWTWRFERRSKILVGSFSSPRRISDLPKKLIGLKIESISFFSRLRELEIKLSRECWLLSFATSKGSPEWAIKNQTGKWLSFKKGRFELNSPSESEK